MHKDKQEAARKKRDYHEALCDWRYKNGYGDLEEECAETCNEAIKSDDRWIEMLESADLQFEAYKKAKQVVKNTERRLHTACRNAEKYEVKL